MQKPKLFSILKHRKKELNKKIVINDIISGIIVGIIALPLSIALAIASGVSPEKGLITAIIAGFMISFFGGSRVQIGGPTGAFVVIVYGIVQKYGLNGLIISTFLAGVFLIIFGLLNFGSVIKYIPYPITIGFTSGIAVVLFSTQVKDFMGFQFSKSSTEFFENWYLLLSNIKTINSYALTIGVIAVGIIVYFPKINKTIPGALVALIFTTLAVALLKLPVDTIGIRFGVISSKLPEPAFFMLDLMTIKELIRPAITIALLAGIESLLSATVADSMIGKKHNSNMELIGQGIANIASAIFGGIPATGAIARTAANVKNGGKTPIAGIVHAVTLFLIMVIFMPYASLIPLATLSAILIVVAYNMSEWRTFQYLLRSTRNDIIVMFMTFLLTVVVDLVVAIEVGMVLAMFLFIKNVSETIKVSDQLSVFEDSHEEKLHDDDIYEENLAYDIKDDIMVYEVSGPLLFGASNTFMNLFENLKQDKKALVLRMKNVPVMDATGLVAINNMQLICNKNNIIFVLTELQKQPYVLLKYSGYREKVGRKSIQRTFSGAIKHLESIYK